MILNPSIRRYRKPNFRAVKLAREIQILLSALLQKGVIKDTRVQKYDVTVTHVDCGEDLKHAWVYVSCLGLQKPPPEAQQQLLAGLQHARGFIMSKLNRNLGLFRSPELTFQMDHHLYQAEHVVELIDQVSTPPS